MSREQMKARLEAANPGALTAEHRSKLDWLSSSPYINSDEHQPGSTIHQGSKANPVWGSLWPHRNAKATAELFAHAPSDLADLHAALDAVEALHKPERGTVHDPDDGETKEMDYCETCSDSPWLDEASAVAWPCPTIRAISDALGEDQA